MRFQSTAKKSSSSFSRAIIVVLVLVAVMFGIDQVAPHLLSSTVSAIAGPVWEMQLARDSYLGNAAVLLQDKEQLQDENERLQRELRQARIAVLNKKVLERENEQLRKQLGRREQGTDSAIGRILVRPNASPYDTFILDIGARDGVSAGDMLVVQDAVIIGEIVAVSSRTARAQLYSTPGREIAVLVGTDDTVQASAAGVGGGNLRITLPRGVAVQRGVPIRPAELPDYMIGTVERVEKSPADSFQTIYFRLPVNIHEVSFVEVVSAGSI